MPPGGLQAPLARSWMLHYYYLRAGRVMITATAIMDDEVKSSKPAKATAELNALMRKHKLNSPQVAEMVGVKPNTVRKWCCGLRPVPFYAIRLIKLLAA